MLLKAPYPAIQTIVTLPEPHLNNDVFLLDERNYKYMMDKSVYSYIKTTPLKRYKYVFTLTRGKLFEVFEFLKAYLGVKWEIIDHHGNSIIGYCVTNPSKFTSTLGPLAYKANCLPYTENEKFTFELEFEG